ncbi:MAG: UDP-N-acetylglucosamine 4,6-dehydratase (inverting) [Candidatus Kaiserbacteria bacterium]|nr:UDP-N-acetylglucosamine 4,6-dehydratase (inverting) [Candidatus Kaiserbacteria bacterium]
MSIIDGKTVLITGGTGSFGKACVRQILVKHKPKAVRIFSRDELKQWDMRREFNDDPRLRFLIGDVRDASRVRRATEGVDILIHAAAMKQVPACEYNPMEAIKTNVDGAMNVINAALDNNIPRVIALSTDKAASPVNLYGATKLCSDRLFIQSNEYRGPKRDTMFSVVRYGNVMGSRGSVIPLFRKQKEKGELTITHEEMTRFWITLPQAVDLVLSSLEVMQGGELFVPKIPTMKIVDLAKTIAPEATCRVVGIRPGEKMHECLITQEEGRLAYELADRYVVLSPSLSDMPDIKKYKKAKKLPEGFEYHSHTNDKTLSPKEMSKLLAEIDAH